jgi:hypothetical protein
MHDFAHDYQWTFDQPGNCMGQFECTRCGGTWLRQVRHDYQWEFFQPAACEGQHCCSRCGDTVSQEAPHEWAWLTEPTETDCPRTACRRCARAETRRHDFQWTFAEDLTPRTEQARQAVARALRRAYAGGCLQLWACAHCGWPDPLRHQEAHSWTETISSDDYYRDCSRCGRRDTQPGLD